MAANRNRTPWDIYVDETKQGPYCLGFLEVPNTPSFEHKLFRCRHILCGPLRGHVIRRELHWTRLNHDVLPIATKWIDCVFKHHGARFWVLDWPKSTAKEVVLLEYIARFIRRKRLTSIPTNLVMFLDFDSDHSKHKTQNVVRELGHIARCYHVTSSGNDCVQCCDVLLGAIWKLRDDPTVRMGFAALKERMDGGGRLKQSESKRYLAGYLASKLDKDETSVHDLRRMAR